MRRQTAKRATGRRRSRTWRARIADVALAAAVLAAIALVAARLGGAGSVTLEGVPAIIDGDTLDLAGTRIRLEGIDAPELRQQCHRSGGAAYACGSAARAALGELIDGRAIRCKGGRRDRYGRLLAACSVSGAEINSMLVEMGWAVAYGGYEQEEGRARGRHAGLWDGSFDRPHDWRAVHGGVDEFPDGIGNSVVGWLRHVIHMLFG